MKYSSKAYSVVSHKNIAYASSNSSLGCQKFIIEGVKSLIHLTNSTRSIWMHKNGAADIYIKDIFFYVVFFHLEKITGSVLNW